MVEEHDDIQVVVGGQVPPNATRGERGYDYPDMVEEHVDTIEDHDDDTMGGVDDDSFRVTGVTEVIGDPIENA